MTIHLLHNNKNEGIKELIISYLTITVAAIIIIIEIKSLLIIM